MKNLKRKKTLKGRKSEEVESVEESRKEEI